LPAPSTDRVDQIGDFVDQRLQHHRSETLSVLSESGLDVKAKAIFALFRLFVDAEKSGSGVEETDFLERLFDAMAEPMS
jgi:hypothetical protein